MVDNFTLSHEEGIKEVINNLLKEGEVKIWWGFRRKKVPTLDAALQGVPAEETVVYPVNAREWRRYWGPEDAVRELLMNAHDAFVREKDGKKKSDIRFGMVCNNKYLAIYTIGTKGLRKEYFIFGVGENSRDESIFGMYGDGLKMALFTLAREGYKVHFIYKDESSRISIGTKYKVATVELVKGPGNVVVPKLVIKSLPKELTNLLKEKNISSLVLILGHKDEDLGSKVERLYKKEYDTNEILYRSKDFVITTESNIVRIEGIKVFEGTDKTIKLAFGYDFKLTKEVRELLRSTRNDVKQIDSNALTKYLRETIWKHMDDEKLWQRLIKGIVEGKINEDCAEYGIFYSLLNRLNTLDEKVKGAIANAFINVIEEHRKHGQEVYILNRYQLSDEKFELVETLIRKSKNFEKTLLLEYPSSRSELEKIAKALLENDSTTCEMIKKYFREHKLWIEGNSGIGIIVKKVYNSSPEFYKFEELPRSIQSGIEAFKILLEKYGVFGNQEKIKVLVQKAQIPETLYSSQKRILKDIMDKSLVRIENKGNHGILVVPETIFQVLGYKDRNLKWMDTSYSALRSLVEAYNGVKGYNLSRSIDDEIKETLVSMLVQQYKSG